MPDLWKPVLAPSLLCRTIAQDRRYYAHLEAFTDAPPIAQQRHYVFQTVDLVRWPQWIVHAGVGEGLTAASTKWIVTTIVGHVF